ncbi:MAG TPA: tRNA (adenosine(37)-N6)-threonylcarbamoyltransferase complex ATPase subunit type 1 TsaE [Steroidobacteraceae bacterium]|jgi:tRNA threonylcarbamoyladenosine biosynthesis protein TsaE|nr:tRNA (adenosine(37)-N6)-threonylcarbamoyltransferase complex ATPase subunit type 1 TsaE [Steroidobacteraceae bacterium]
MSPVWPLPQVQCTEQLGRALARSCPWSDSTARVLYLCGELGAGKTTLASALLHELGVTEPVRSPSYALIELYQAGAHPAVHIDLYRLSAPTELQTLGLRDYLNCQTLLLIEWPERGGSALPSADLRVELTTQPARSASARAESDAGQVWLAAMNPAMMAEVKT